MKASKPKTIVIFRRYKRKPTDVFAIFPEHYEGLRTVSCYEHIGQHSHAEYADLIQISRPVKLSDRDVRELVVELRLIGYKNLKPRARWSNRSET